MPTVLRSGQQPGCRSKELRIIERLLVGNEASLKAAWHEYLGEEPLEHEAG